MIETLERNGEVLAIIVRASFREEGIHFFTPNDFSQQLGFMSHPAGKIIEPHLHNPVERKVSYTQEVLLIKSGRLRVDFYDQKKSYFESRTLGAGDVILLAKGGHGFEALEAVEMFEVKQGPYAGEADKTRFQAIEPGEIVVRAASDE
jgi:mannose-6-phosphate isomerase-like protein (cupin superfamily)